MIKPKLSPHAAEMLILIGDHCDPDGRYFVPPAGNKTAWSETMGREIFVDGQPSAAAINALIRKGLVERMRLGKYSAKITEEGRKLIEHWRETGWPVKVRD